MASCITNHWGSSTSPQISLEVTTQSETKTSATLYYVLKYVATKYAVSTSVSKSYSIKIDGATVKSGSFAINGKTGTHVITSGTKTITKTSGDKKIAFSLSFGMNVVWSGKLASTLTASGTTSICKSGEIGKPSTPGTSGPTGPAPVITKLDVQNETDRTVFATWNWDKEHTDYYRVIWYYATGNGVWFIGEDTTVKNRQSVWTAPSNADKIRIKVKAISTTHTVDKKTVSYWTYDWSAEKIYTFKVDNDPVTPPVPNVTIKDLVLTATLENLDVKATHIQFQTVKNDMSIVSTLKVEITKFKTATYTCRLSAGSTYRVRCRSVKGSLYSKWSDYSGTNDTRPTRPKPIWSCKATSATSVSLAWDKVSTAITYDLEYTTNKSYFYGSDKVNSITGIKTTQYEKTGLESGQEYFFRVRAVGEQGASEWSDICSVVLGKNPAAPTTWSSSTTVMIGEPLILYWVHNSEDGSNQKLAEVEMYVNGVKETQLISTEPSEDDPIDKTQSYTLNTYEYSDGTKIEWRVRTAGITGMFGDWSIQRTIDIHVPPTLAVDVTDSSGQPFDILSQFPFYIRGVAEPDSQMPIGYMVSITSNDVYETVDRVGNTKIVNYGEEVYYATFDTSEQLLVEFSANNIDLQNNISYTVTCSVTMDTGLTAETSFEFWVFWNDEQYLPNAMVGVDPDSLTASIGPYCVDDDGELVNDVMLSVYRREYDGTFTEIATEIDNSTGTFVTDPHPSLDYARYRIIAITNSTGAVSYYDVPGCPVNQPGIVIQWDEQWRSFDHSEEYELEERTWSGSMLKLPYNVDISEKNNPDVTLTEYIGRKHPVSYYGTHLGESASWNLDIDKEDTETLYSLRRLRNWMGDVYVRESSGSSYWANISVSFKKTHKELVIPVTLEVARVEGGM